MSGEASVESRRNHAQTGDVETLYFVTALSNLIRGFDKYSRIYDKARIIESTFPGRFFLLTRDELPIGIRKASHLPEKTRLVGDRLVVLQTHARTDELFPNSRTGLGRFVERSGILLDAVHFVDAGGALEPLVLEEACAQSYRVVGRRLAPFENLSPRSVSVLPIARACQARCPFCFSKASASADTEARSPDWLRV
jgi:hypothetical protein